MSLTLEVITPRRVLLSTEAAEVTLPGEMGELGVLAGHIPVLTSLTSGLLAYGRGKDKKLVAVHYGFAEVKDDKVVVLAKDADLPEEINAAEVQTELEGIAAQLAEADRGSEGEASLLAEQRLAETRLLAAEASKATQH